MRFGELLKTAASEGKEKHVPVFEVKTIAEKLQVNVIIGKEVAHPNTFEHHIEWIQLFGVKASQQLVQLGYYKFEPAFADPAVATTIKNGEFTTLLALGYCNIHGVWENSVSL